MIKEKMKSGGSVFGTWCDIPSSTVANIIAKAGLDFIIIDMEHGVMDFNIVQDMVMSAGCDGCDALIRVSRNEESDILRALDTGAAGIIVPHIRTVDCCKKAVSFSKFPPLGKRGFNPYIRAGGYQKVSKEYLRDQNNNVLVGVILEGKSALEHIDEILSEPGIDLVYIGTYDLSVALGVPGDVTNPIVVDALESAVVKIRARDKSAGCMIHDEKELKRAKELGIQFITYKVDSGVLRASFQRMKEEFEK